MGKGSARRTENLALVHEGFDRIFGESKLERRLREEREAQYEHVGEDQEPDWGEGNPCPVCGTELALTGAGLHWHCDVCGHDTRAYRG